MNRHSEVCMLSYKYANANMYSLDTKTYERGNTTIQNVLTGKLIIDIHVIIIVRAYIFSLHYYARIFLMFSLPLSLFTILYEKKPQYVVDIFNNPIF